MAGDMPDYLSANDDGSITVRLHGDRVITLRDMSVADSERYSKMSKRDESGAEIALLADLSGEMSPDDIRSMSMRDYTRLQAALPFFLV